MDRSDWYWLKLKFRHPSRFFGPNGFWGWAAYRLPRRLAYFCTIRVGVAATTGQWSGQVVPELHLVDALTRWSGEG